MVESLIKSVRQALNASSKNKTLTEEQWRTYLVEVTCLINGRPLYPNSVEIWETPPVTPNDLLIGHHFPPPVPEPEQRVDPRHLMRSTEERVHEFRNCWIKFFAPNLLPRNKWFKKREPPRRRLGAGDRAHPEENMEDGLSDSDLPRTRWTHEEGEDKDCYVGF